MNAVEIEEAITRLAEQQFDEDEFPYDFLEAFGNKLTTLKRLKAGASNNSNLGGVLQRNSIHIVVSQRGGVGDDISALERCPATKKAKAKFALATDGHEFQAVDLVSGETIACEFSAFPDHVGFFLPLAGISTVQQIRENAFDVRATGRLNCLYIELLKHNSAWGTAERRQDMNHFMARLVFCFFAEDTNIFSGKNLFTDNVAKMSAAEPTNTHEVIEALFEALNTDYAKRSASGLARWACAFPYVNSGVFSGKSEVPIFSKTARSYLLHLGSLDWTKINPDIFGSMIQAVTDDEERGAVGMHYTSVPNILKVLNPLFLDDLRKQLASAGLNRSKLQRLGDRMSKIRVFDPACGSGNFLVIAYKEMRAIEAVANERRKKPDLSSKIPLTNFRGIELRYFPVEIARLALIIAEFQCDKLYRKQQGASTKLLPLDSNNWLTCGNALQLDWLSVCSATGNSTGQIYVCGNPPYKGGTEQNAEQKSDMALVFKGVSKTWKSLDYSSGWLFKFAQFAQATEASCAFVSTNSICQGEQVSRLWPLLFEAGLTISFAHTSFKWANLAAHNAGVMVVIIGLSRGELRSARIFELDPNGQAISRTVREINAYLVAGKNTIVEPRTNPLFAEFEMTIGNKPADGGHLILDSTARQQLEAEAPDALQFILPYVGTAEFIRGNSRYCIWITEDNLDAARSNRAVTARIEKVREFRLKSSKELTRKSASTAHRFQQVRQTGAEELLVVARHTSERRKYMPVGVFPRKSIVADSAFGMYDVPLWNMALIASRLHLVWIATVCGKIKTDFRYSNTLGWNTFPIPALTSKNKADLSECAENILLARQAHFPASIAQLYDDEKMPGTLRQAHTQNDEVTERIYRGRIFRNDTERLESLFFLYTKMFSKNNGRPTKA